MNKRLISLFLTFVMIVTLLPQMVVEASVVHSGTCGENLTWTIDDVGTLSISGNGEMYDYSSFESPWSSNSNDIRAVVISYGTTSIGGYAFEECSNLISVTIPDSVTSIGNGAFSRCWNLTDIHIPNSVISIGKHAFSECNFNSIVIPNGVNCIAYGAFMNCSNLSDIIIPSSVTSIGECSFYGCLSLDNVIIPNNVMSIGNSAFHSCSSLTNITIPNTVSTIERYAFIFCDSLTDVYYTDTEEQWNIIDIEDTNGPLLNATIHFESTVQSDNNFAGNYNEFMQQKAYQVYWDSSTYGHNSPTQYAFIDLDKDDNKELIICSDSDFGFNSFLVFDYHENLNQVTMVPVMGTGYEITSFYGGLEYSDQYAALVFTETNDGSAFGGLSYYSINDGKLSSSFHIGYENYDGSGAKYYTSTEKNISEEQYFEYIFESVAIEFYPITDFVPMDILEKTNEHYARTEWIEQHMEYATSDEYKKEIVRGLAGGLNDLFVDIKNDDVIKLYSTLDTINHILSFDIDLNEAQEYELLLGQIFFSYIGEDAIEEIYAENMTRTVIMLGELMLKSDDFKQIGDSKQLEGILDALKSSEGVDKMNAACDSFFNFVDGYDNLNIKKHLADNIKEESFNLAWDVAIDSLDLVTTTLKELTMYVAAGEAYSHTSDAFGKLLLMMRQNIDVDSNNPIFQPIPSKDLVTNEVIWNLTVTSDSTFPDPLNTPVVLKDLATAIESFYLSIETYKNEDSTYIAQNALADLKDGAVNDVLINNCENAAVSLFSCLPIVREYKIMRDILSTGQSLIDIVTSIDDQEYLGTMFIRLYCISYLHYLTVNNLAGPPESWESVPYQDLYGYQFMRATSFDEAVNVYKSISVVAANYALKYTNIFLGEALVELNTYDNGGFFEQFLKNRDKLVQAVNDYKNTVVKLEKQRTEIQAISCHDADLQYDFVNDEIIYNFKDSRIYVVACPVDVIVKNESGEQIAYLYGEDNEVMEGYEFYFHTIKMPDESGEYIKVAIAPDGYRVELVGTDDGTMNAFVTDFTSGDVGEIETYFNIPIEKDSVGYFEINSEKTNESGLVMDQVVYSNMESIENVPTNSESDGVWLWILGGTIVCVIILILVFKKKSRE